MAIPQSPPPVKRRRTSFSSPNSFGIKPLGNLLLDSLSPHFKGNCRLPGLGSFAPVPDEAILAFLTDHITPTTLLTLSSTSKAFYVLSRNSDLWRSLVIRDFGPRGTFLYHRSWLETYARASLSLASSSLDRLHPHRPLTVSSFYSDYLYQSHVCATRPLSFFLPKEDNIDRRSRLSLQDFVDEYEKPNKPVIITDAISSWPAYKKWSRQYLLDHFADRNFTAEAVDLRLDHYLAYADAQADESPLYLFDKLFAKRCPELSRDYSVPEYFREDLFRLLGDDRPDYQWLIIGPERSGSTFHKDPNATSAWNAVITGSKKWIMYPPNIPPPGVFTNNDESEVTSPVSLAEWFVNFYEQTKKGPGPRPLEGICRSGEVIFVPAGWWHAVINLEFSIAITQNYVGGQNLVSVLDFLKRKPDQISGLGCPDPEPTEEGDGTKCDDEKKRTFYERFRKVLRESEPGLLKRAEEELEMIEEKRRIAEVGKNRPSLWENLKTSDVDTTVGGFSFSFGGEDDFIDEEIEYNDNLA